jgi:peroxiredoxin
MPSSYVIGRDGEIITRHLGFKVKRQDEYEAVLREALAANQETNDAD